VGVGTVAAATMAATTQVHLRAHPGAHLVWRLPDAHDLVEALRAALGPRRRDAVRRERAGGGGERRRRGGGGRRAARRLAR
jgi:hypothetical protein